eukprot:GHUV01004742.1.p1 GENE.GHUV01004742.1~~GHUV01004742.1.p1  ORF type:complete len:246 (+),score=69.53 GHUV01004742.1:114-851(+)
MLQQQRPLQYTSARRSTICLASTRCTVHGTNGGSQQSQQQQQIDRRAVLSSITSGCVLSVQGMLPAPATAEVDLRKAVANNFVDWWKSRRTLNGGAKLLNPIYVAQQRLQQAAELLGNGSVNSDVATEALQLVRASSLNCFMFEPLESDTFETKASIMTQKYELSDPCTFRIILRNVTSLEPEATQQVAKDKMDALVLSYQRLDTYLDMAREGNTEVIPKAKDELKTTMLIAADIESFVKTTLGV